MKAPLESVVEEADRVNGDGGPSKGEAGDQHLEDLKGANREEILEVFHLASVTGLEGYILGAEAMHSHRSD